MFLKIIKKQHDGTDLLLNKESGKFNLGWMYENGYGVLKIIKKQFDCTDLLLNKDMKTHSLI